MFVTHVYAAEGVVEPVRTGIPEGSLNCYSEDPRYRETSSTGSSSNGRLSTFSVYPVMTPEGMGTRLQFGQIAGRPEISKTTIEIPGLKFLVKRDWDRVRRIPVMIVTEADKNLRLEIPLRGGIYGGVSVEVIYATGAPVLLNFKRNGATIAEETITTCSQ
jgi:hypothetical protein